MMLNVYSLAPSALRERHANVCMFVCCENPPERKPGSGALDGMKNIFKFRDVILIGHGRA